MKASITEAKAPLSTLIEAAEHGEEVLKPHDTATTRPLLSVDQVTKLLQETAPKRRICVDVGAAMKMPQVAVVEFLGDRDRLHVVPAPEDALDDPFADWCKPLGDTVDFK
ncbi:hypothetical protein CLV79_10916 [Limimaricola soesokkakensis]|uniref:Uncharacterized protein n=1 Tax=Limimaricola soesokkakensis TaxID=1343159 RepID=A0A1X6ZSY6_9RHOB|nr:hypothetical protein [Limimaricola soesokkakensis]PSK84044.1 hypothetical protein CLV79_10916 [Limimaricola soesokkakensis]SLN59875.1 hypothetical protein LOS8367_02882 [Limimaricola soesokkakensis]